MWYNQGMVRSPWEKQPRPIIAAVLALVVLGTLALLGAEIFYGIEMGGSKPYSNGIFAPVDHTIDWFAENVITVNRTKKVASPVLRNGGPRVLMLFKMYSAAEYLTLLPVHTVNPDSFPHIKNDIPLKLRI